MGKHTVATTIQWHITSTSSWSNNPSTQLDCLCSICKPKTCTSAIPPLALGIYQILKSRNTVSWRCFHHQVPFGIVGPRSPTHAKATVGWNYPTAAAWTCLLPSPRFPTKFTQSKFGTNRKTGWNLVGWRVNFWTSPFSFVKPGGFFCWFLLWTVNKTPATSVFGKRFGLNIFTNQQCNIGSWRIPGMEGRHSKSFEDVLLRERFLETKILQDHTETRKQHKI